MATRRPSGLVGLARLRRTALSLLPRDAKDRGNAGIVAVRRHSPAPLVRAAERAARRTVATPGDLIDARRSRRAAPAEDTRLWIAPANFAGQGHAWARAAAALPGVGARSMNVAGPIRFATDYEVPAAVYRDLTWQREQFAALQEWTHVLVEAERPVTGSLFGTCAAEADALEARGVRVAHLIHGSDARRPDLHRATHAHSPFGDPTDPRTARLQRLTARNHAYVTACDRPVFVSTPDMLETVPNATWLPVVVDPQVWATDTVPLQRDRPRVVHAPSNGWLKGSDLIDPLMTELDAAGVIEYRTLRGLDRAGMRREYREADIVLDQFVLGLYGVAAAEAMAAGRVVVAYVGDAVRQHVRGATGEDVPIIEAAPDSLVDVIESICRDRATARDTAARGPSFVRRVHDGTRSAAVLSDFLRI